MLRFGAIVGVGGSLLAVAVPSFYRNASASKLTEALDGLARITATATSKASQHAQHESFPPTVERTPAEVPRGRLVRDPTGTWDHLTWRALAFRMDEEHAYAFSFESSHDPVSGLARFSATAQGDLDGDGNLSTFQVRGERKPGEEARAWPGLLVDRELE